MAYAASNQKKHTKYQLIELYKACHEMASSASRYKMVAKIACLKIGLLYYDIARFHEALNYHEKHLRICRETGNLAEEGRAYCSIGCVYHSLGQYQKAMEYHEKYLRICKQTGDLSGEGTSYGNIGVVCRSLGQYQKAMEYHKKHLCINRETGNLAGEGRAYGNIGGVYRCLGQYQKTMEYCEKYLLTCQETGDLAEEGRAYCSIGCVYHSLGQYQKAMEYHEKHLCICQETGHLTGEGTSYGNIGVVYKSLGQYQKAMEYNEKHLRMCQETGHLTEEGRAYRNIGGVYHELGQYQKAMEYYEEHLRICQETGDLAGEGRSYCSIGGVYYDLGQYQKAMEYNEKHLRICQKTGDLSGKGGSCCNIGLVYHSLGEYEKAMEYFKNQLRICHETGDLTAEGQIYYNIGLARFKNDDIHEAEISLKESVRCFEEIFKFLHQQDNYKVSIVDTYIKTYRFLTKVLIASGKVKEALLISERGRAQALRDKLVMKYGEEGTSELPNGDIDSLLSSSESSFLFLSIQYHEVFLFVIEQGKELHLRRTLSRPCLGQKTREELMSHINKMLQNNANVFEDLYQVLIAPVEEALTKPEIIIIPDGPFFFVPFAALKDKSGTFLSETKRIRIGPSLTTLKLLKECPAEKHCKKGALIVGGPEAVEVMYRGKKKTFDDLQNARLEARIIGGKLGEKPLTGSSARKDRVKRRLQEGVSIIHIATHGDETTGELLLAPEPCDDEDDEEIPKEEEYMLTVEEIYSSRINAQLVVLSCCHSGRGEIKAEGVVGLTRAFLAAGARSVLASLWAIDDLATCFFMEAFYRHLKSGESASESLQQAMKEMRKKPAFSHPRFWASFFIVGDDIRINT